MRNRPANAPQSSKRRKITQQDVAQHVGLSTGTVSRVLNNDSHVDRATRKKVLEAIEKLGYIPNHAAQALAFGKTNSILLLILDKEPIFPSTWQYELPVLQGINNHIREKGYILQIEMMNYNEGFTVDEAHDRLLRSRSVDGLIILSSWPAGDELVRKIAMYRIPTIFIGSGPYVYKNNPVGSAVLFDNFSVIKEAYKGLYENGHRRIAFVKGAETQLHSNIRLEAFYEAARECGQTVHDSYVFHGNYSVQGGYQALHDFIRLPEKPSAVICANDLMAIGLMKAAVDLGISIPAELSVIGFDDIEIAEYLSPPLSTIKVPSYDLGFTGASMLIRQIEKGIEPETLILPAAYIERNSTGAYAPSGRKKGAGAFR